MLRLDRHAPPLEPLVGLGLAASLLGAMGVARALPASGFGAPCLFLLLSGWPCPTCGMTRAAMAAVHGDAVGALLWNPLGAGLAVAGAVGAVYLLGRQLGAPALRLRGAPPRGWRALAIAAALANWAYVALAGRVA